MFCHFDVNGANLNDYHNNGSPSADIGHGLRGATTASTTTTVVSGHNDRHLQLPTGSTNISDLLAHSTASTNGNHAGTPTHNLLLPANDIPLDATSTTTANLPHRLSWLLNSHHAAAPTPADYAVITVYAATCDNHNFNEHCPSHHDGVKRAPGHVTTSSTTAAAATTTRGDEPEFDIGL